MPKKPTKLDPIFAAAELPREERRIWLNNAEEAWGWDWYLHQWMLWGWAPFATGQEEPSMWLPGERLTVSPAGIRWWREELRLSPDIHHESPTETDKAE